MVTVIQRHSSCPLTYPVRPFLPTVDRALHASKHLYIFSHKALFYSDSDRPSQRTFQRLTLWRCRFKGHGIHCFVVNTNYVPSLHSSGTVTLRCMHIINLQHTCVHVFCASYQPLCIIGHSADSDCEALRHKTEHDTPIFIMHLGALKRRARDALYVLSSSGERGFGGRWWWWGGYCVRCYAS